MRRFNSVLFVVTLLAGYLFSSLSAASDGVEKGRLNDVSAVELLYALDVSNATISHQGRSQYLLVVPLDSISSVHGFSNKQTHVACKNRQSCSGASELVLSVPEMYMGESPSVTVSWKEAQAAASTTYLMVSVKQVGQSLVYQLRQTAEAVASGAVSVADQSGAMVLDVWRKGESWIKHPEVLR